MNGTVTSPAAAQVKDSERVRRSRTTPTRGEPRELSMSVQPIAPTSRQPSQLRDGMVTPATHPYASASATPTPSTPIRDGGIGVTVGGTFNRTTSNSPLPPIPGDERGERENAVTPGPGQSGSNVALNSSPGPIQAYPRPSSTAPPPSVPRGMTAQRVDRMTYEAPQPVQEELPRRRNGFLSLFCCRA